MQKAQFIDVTKSYLPCDPDSFVQNLINTNQEDGEEKALPVLPFDGYNFIPTNYGYRAFFGIDSKLDCGELTSRCQFILSYQTAEFKTILIALAEDGIWTLDTSVSASTWTQEVTHTFDENVFEEWTYCVIENVLYCYKQGYTVVYTVDNTASVDSITPNFLNMSGQLGIFKAGTRLGFWDSANSVSWSNNVDLSDFTPAIETYAGNRIFGDVVGRIVTIKAHGEGFIVYSTRSIVAAVFSEAGTLLWDSKTVFDSIGISHSRAITSGQNDNIHFVWSTAGVISIGSYDYISGNAKTEFLIPELYDLLSERRLPVYLDCINNRYLMIQIFNNVYLYGAVSYIRSIGVNPQLTSIQIDSGYWDGDLDALPSVLDGNTFLTLLEQFGLRNMPTNSPSNSCL